MMAYAEFLAGMAFNSASLGYVHAMAHQLGGMYNLPHGVCNAILLGPVQAGLYWGITSWCYRHSDLEGGCWACYGITWAISGVRREVL